MNNIVIVVNFLKGFSFFILAIVALLAVSRSIKIKKNSAYVCAMSTVVTVLCGLVNITYHNPVIDLVRMMSLIVMTVSSIIVWLVLRKSTDQKDKEVATFLGLLILLQFIFPAINATIKALYPQSNSAITKIIPGIQNTTNKQATPTQSIATTTNISIHSEALIKALNGKMLYTGGWTIIPSTLKIGDLNNDGLDDVLALVERINSTESYENILSIWLRSQNGDYVPYSTAYYDLRLKSDESKECEITIIKGGIIQLNCVFTSNKYPTNKRISYFKLSRTGSGLVRAHTYEQSIEILPVTTGWSTYHDQTLGVSIQAPLGWVERVVVPLWAKLDPLNDSRTLVLEKNGVSISIQGVKNHPSIGQGGFVLSADAWYENIFTKSGLQLVRITPSRLDFKNEELAFDHFSNDTVISNVYIPNIGKVNNVGSIDDIVDYPYTRDDINYNIFIGIKANNYNTSSALLKEADAILTTLVFTKSLNQSLETGLSSTVEEKQITTVQPTLSIPALYTENTKSTYPGQKGSVWHKEFVANSDVAVDYYNLPNLTIDEFPYQTLDFSSLYSSGGYSVDSGMCKTYEGNKSTEMIQGQTVCPIQAGEGGGGFRGYLIIDPNKKYIVRIIQDFGELTHLINLESIIGSVKW